MVHSCFDEMLPKRNQCKNCYWNKMNHFATNINICQMLHSNLQNWRQNIHKNQVKEAVKLIFTFCTALITIVAAMIYIIIKLNHDLCLFLLHKIVIFHNFPSDLLWCLLKIIFQVTSHCLTINTYRNI